MIEPVMAISNLVLTQQIYSEETNGAHADYREPVPLTPDVWKCAEMCLHCLYPKTLEVWKTGNLEMCLVWFNLITLKV